MSAIIRAAFVCAFLFGGISAADARGSSHGKSYSPKSYSSGKSHGSGYVNPNNHGVRGYTRKDGTYVAPHRQTNSNSTKNDNYSTRGNTNPWTGKAGTKPGD